MTSICSEEALGRDNWTDPGIGKITRGFKHVVAADSCSVVSVIHRAYGERK